MKNVVITGANKGIGLACAQIFIENNFTVWAWNRSKSTYTNSNYKEITCDVTDKQAVKLAFDNTIKGIGNNGAIDVLINNAGFGEPGKLEDMSTDVWENMFATNVNGLFYCTKAVIPNMKTLERGHIFNIGSVASNTGIETMSAYCGTKFAVKGISHSLYKELRPFGIKVTCIYPGSVNTNFFDPFEHVQANNNMMQASDVAKTIFQAYDSSFNFHLVDIEMRPLQPKK